MSVYLLAADQINIPNHIGKYKHLVGSFIFLSLYSSCNFQAFCDQTGILFISASTYYSIKTALVYPIIWSYWLVSTATNIAAIKVLEI